MRRPSRFVRESWAAALELGCGTGRLCRRLHELGLQVTGVDESAEMLAHLPAEIEGIQASIESLQLGRRWPAVLLPSHLINHPDEAARKQFAQAAMRHLAARGTFYVQRHSPRWLSTVKAGPLGNRNGVALHADSVSRDGDVVTMTLRYEALNQSWTQTFSTTALSAAQIEALLRGCGFKRFAWLGTDRLWLAAKPTSAS